MKKAIIFGMGNIGAVLMKRLAEENIDVKYVVNSRGIFDTKFNKVAEKDKWKEISMDVDIVFECIPTDNDGNCALEYAMYFLSRGNLVITCEKASVAYHWDILKKYRSLFKYTASVGGGTQMLKEISLYKPKDILEIKAVVNGTLNYISWAINSGQKVEDVVREVLEKGYAEPGSNSLTEIIKNELNDVVLKTIIIANHSGMFAKTISKEDIKVIEPGMISTGMKRCVVRIAKGKIEVGFIENNDEGWLPDGILNVLYINGGLKARGPGAGAGATVFSMIADLN
ncbi:MAG: hypothetical protein V4664_00720 [Patescibacteria group bacterium]